MSKSYDSSDEEFDIQEEEDIAMLLAIHANKKPKHGGSVFGRQKLRRERIEADNRLMRHYFVDHPIYPESYFRRRFRMSIELFRHIAEKLARHDRFFQQRRNDAMKRIRNFKKISSRSGGHGMGNNELVNYAFYCCMNYLFVL